MMDNQKNEVKLKSDNDSRTNGNDCNWWDNW